MMLNNTIPKIIQVSEPLFLELQVDIVENVGFMGLSMASRLGGLGSSMIMPIATGNSRHFENVKELKVTGATSTL